MVNEKDICLLKTDQELVVTSKLNRDKKKLVYIDG